MTDVAFKRFVDLPHVSFVVPSVPLRLPMEDGSVFESTHGMVGYPQWTVPIDGIIQILDELWIASVAENATPDLMHDVPAFERYAARETARVGAHVVFACNAMDIIAREAQAAAAILDDLVPAGETPRKAALDALPAALRTSRLLRDKVFAHAAAVKPPPPGKLKKDGPDPFGVRATSVYYLSGTATAFRNNDFLVGGAQIAPANGPPDAWSLPAVTLREMRAEAVAAFDQGWDLLADMIDGIRAFSQAEIQAKYPTVREFASSPRRGS